MVSLILIFCGTFWEASMDIIGQKHNYEQSRWKLLADYFDRRNMQLFGNQFWDNSIAWRNKWKMNDPMNGEAFFGSSTVFVSVIDGWHFVKFIWLIHVFLAIIMFDHITDYLLIDLLLLYFAFGVGHELFLRLLKINALVNKPKT